LFAGRVDIISSSEITRYIKLAGVKDDCQSPSQILEHTSHKFKVEVKELISKSRSRRVVTARNYAIGMMREKLNLTLKEIGRHVGYRDHATIRHALMSQNKGAVAV
jgi:chromosomal replication initiation ATPase DnaA